MRKVMDVLRLVYEAGRSQEEIARSVGLSQSTVSDYLGRFRSSGIGGPVPPALDAAALEAELFRRPERCRGSSCARSRTGRPCMRSANGRA